MCTLVSSTSGETEAMTKGLGSETRKLHRQLFRRSSKGLHQVLNQMLMTVSIEGDYLGLKKEGQGGKMISRLTRPVMLPTKKLTSDQNVSK